jgi:hypothetical protein
VKKVRGFSKRLGMRSDNLELWVFSWLWWGTWYNRHIAAAISALHWWKSLLEYVTRWHKTSLNGHCEEWSTFWFIKHNGEGEFRVVSSWCIMGRLSANRFDEDPSLSMWLDNTKPRWMSLVRLLESMIWFVKHTGERESRVNISCGASQQWPLAHCFDEDHYRSM